MGLVEAEKITSPGQLELPPQASEVFAELQEPGRQMFVLEIVDALQKSRRANDLRPVQDVVLTWYRTLTAKQSPRFEASVEWALSGGEGEELTAEEFHDRYASR
jgi:hypothetical protein